MSAHIGRRAVYAALALADAPTPIETAWRDDMSIRLVFASVDDLRAWVVAETPGETISEHPFKGTNGDDRPGVTAAAFPDDWHGWELYLRADTRTSIAAELDEQTREQLRAVADEPDAPQDGTR